MTAPIDPSSLSSLRGRFIVLDGPEGCGKTTQSKLLAAALQGAGLAVMQVRDPGTTHIGEQVRAILLDPAHQEMGMRCEMLLYMAARAQMMHQTILPALTGGQVVICDRFVSSTLAYQLGGDGLTAEEIRATGDVAIKGWWPDMTIILDMPAEAAMARVRREKDRIEQRSLDYHEQVRRNFLAQAKADPMRYRILDANRPIDTVQADLFAVIAALAQG